MGPISVAPYMNLAVSHADMGYYAKERVFGAQGDFVTSPEISPLFGEVSV